MAIHARIRHSEPANRFSAQEFCSLTKLCMFLNLIHAIARAIFFKDVI